MSSEITPAEIGAYKLHRRSSVLGSAVNRALALLKRVFNLAIACDLFWESNLVGKVKFFRESNIGVRVLSPEEEEKLLQNAVPHIQDLVRFPLNTGLRIGEIFSLRWFQVDWENPVLNVFGHKTGKTRDVPINAETLKVLQAWHLAKKNEFVFYNPATGKPFVDLKAGFSLACEKAKISGVT